jgi:hypothetical protein
MKQHKAAICFAVAAASVAAFLPLSAAAQVALPPHEIATILHSAGLTQVGPSILRGPNYVVRAIDPYGHEVRVVLDAQRGQILAVRPIMPAVAVRYEDGPGYRSERYVDPRSRPEPFYPGYQTGVGAPRAVEPPGAAGPRIIYAPREAGSIARPGAPPRATAAAKTSAGKVVSKPAPAPKAAPEQPPESPVVSDAAPPTGATAPSASSALASPPVQILE